MSKTGGGRGGVERSRDKFGNKALRAFVAEGYTVFAINPNEEAVEGIQTYSSVLDVPGPIEMATVYVQPEIAESLLAEFEKKQIPRSGSILAPRAIA